jgi:hypothetical protein
VNPYVPSSLNGNNGSWTNSDDTLADVMLAGNNRLNNPQMFRNRVQRNIRQGGGLGDAGIVNGPLVIPIEHQNQSSLRSTGDTSVPHITPSLNPISINVQSSEKTGICYAFQKGKCTRGTACRYRHESSSGGDSPPTSDSTFTGPPASACITDSTKSPILPDPDSPDYVAGIDVVNLYYKMTTPVVVSILGCSKLYLSTNFSRSCLFLYKHFAYFIFIFSAIFLVVSVIMTFNGSPKSAVEVIFSIDSWPVIADIIDSLSHSTSGILSLIILYSISFLLNFVYLFLEFFKFLILHSFHSPSFLCVLLFWHWIAVDKFMCVIDRVITDAIIRFSILEHEDAGTVDKYPHMELPDMDRIEFRSLFLLEDSRLLGGLRINLLWNLAYTHYRTCQIDRNLLKYLSNYRGSKITEHLYRNCHYELRKVVDRNLVNNTIVYFINQEELTQSTLNFLKLSPTSVPVY